MSSLIKSWNGRTIRIRKDRYVSLTDMAQASGKLFGDWKRLKSTESYLHTLTTVMGIPITELIESIQGGTPDDQGTWGHPKVAIRFAQWCSDEFAIQVDCWVDELMSKGKVELLSQQPKLIEPLRRETQAQLLFALNESLKRLPNARGDVIFQSHAINLIEADQQSSDQPQLLSVTEVLEMEGIKIPSGKDSVIGRKVAKAWREVYGDDPKTTAKHIGSGHRTANIKVYPREFFERISAIAQEYLDAC